MQIEIISESSQVHRNMMEKLAKVCNAHKIEYKDLGNGEEYTLTKTEGGSEVTSKITICSNKIDGGFIGSVE